MLIDWVILILWFLIKRWWFWRLLILQSYLAGIHVFVVSGFAVILFISIFLRRNTGFDGYTLVHIWIFIVIAWWVLVSVCKLHLCLSNLASTISELLSSLFFEECLVLLLFLNVILKLMHLLLFELILFNKSSIFLLNWCNFTHVLLKMLW